MRRRVRAGMEPRRDVREVSVVALRLSARRLVLLSEVTACGFHACQGVAAHELAEPQEVRDAPRSLELLVELTGAVGHREISPELTFELLHARERTLESAGVAAQAAARPEQRAESRVILGRGRSTADRKQALRALCHAREGALHGRSV